MKHIKKTLLLAFAVVFLFSGLALAEFQYKIEHPHAGKDVTPSEAHDMLQKNPEHTFLVDIRTRPEYLLIGHPVGAYNIPFQFWTDKLGEKGYAMADNPNFAKDILARFNPKTDTLLIMCRSGSRSCKACNEALKAGWPENKTFNVLGGFEGDKIKYKSSCYYEQRECGGWRNEGLPWTYSIDKKLVYQPDLAK
ncbi:MAG: rhodanese-like domain-containing protein [Deltaproteobacteria bacterium]|nr:rhodanese-like domain-containing protein [Deltaproteobacteria bacterium]